MERVSTPHPTQTLFYFEQLNDSEGSENIVGRRSETDQYWSRLGAVRLSEYFINPDETPIAFLNFRDLMVLTRAFTFSIKMYFFGLITCANINSIRFVTSINLEIYESKLNEKYLHVYI